VETRITEHSLRWLAIRLVFRVEERLEHHGTEIPKAYFLEPVGEGILRELTAWLDSHGITHDPVTLPPWVREDDPAL
jgi:hypothetical protein